MKHLARHDHCVQSPFLKVEWLIVSLLPATYSLNWSLFCCRFARHYFDDKTNTEIHTQPVKCQLVYHVTHCPKHSECCLTLSVSWQYTNLVFELTANYTVIFPTRVPFCSRVSLLIMFNSHCVHVSSCQQTKTSIVFFDWTFCFVVTEW